MEKKNLKQEENIKYIAIVNLFERKILVDYFPPSKKEKKSNVKNNIKKNLIKIKKAKKRNQRHNR